MKRVFTAGIALMMIATSLFAAGVDLTGVGVRSTSLGGNYRAISNDWSGMFWNPAGLVWSKGLKVGGSIEFISPTSGYTAAASPFSGQFSATSASEITNEPKTFLMPAFGVYYSNEKLAYGLGFWAPFGLGAKWDLLNTASYNSKYPEFDFEDDLKVMALQPTIAYKVSDKFSVGLGLTLMYADIMIRKPSFTPNPFLQPSLRAIPPAAALAAPYDHVLTESELNGDGMGFGASFGLQFKPMETLTLGASLKYYNDISLDGTASATNYFATNQAAMGVVKPKLDGMLAGGLIDQATYMQLLAIYSGATNVYLPESDVKADLPLPLNVGAGFAYSGIKNLLITGDIAFTQWSAWDVIEVKGTDGKVINKLTQNWEDGIRLGLGMEYSLALANAKVRAAFYSEPSAAVPETMTPTIPDINRRNTIVFGFGIPIGPTEVGLMYEHIFIGDLTVDKWVPSGTSYENMAGDYTMKVHNIMLGLDYNF